MTTVEFDKILTERLEKIRQVLSSKAAEYASHDRLHNFKQVALADGVTPAQALWGMYLKHWCSVRDLVKTGTTPSAAMVDEKVGDSINYMILLEAIWKEEIGEESVRKGINDLNAMCRDWNKVGPAQEEVVDTTRNQISEEDFKARIQYTDEKGLPSLSALDRSHLDALPILINFIKKCKTEGVPGASKALNDWDQARGGWL